MEKALCRVAGVSFYQPAVLRCEIGDKVRLVPEPKNLYDPNAVRVMCRRKKIGYIPREQAPGVGRLVKSKHYNGCQIYSMGPPPGIETIGVLLEIHYTEEAQIDTIASKPKDSGVVGFFKWLLSKGDWV